MNNETAMLNALLQSYSDNYFAVYQDPKNQFMICQAKTSYVPIEMFKAAFESVSPLVKVHGIKKFIFDKRELRAFHQPSMEWYYTVWKLQLLDCGLSIHRKILPGELWFKSAVEAGLDAIAKDHPHFPFDRIDVQYFDSIEECIAN